MLDIVVPEIELFDNKEQRFIRIKEQTLRLEHSLVSVSKWESKWKKPFLSREPHALEEYVDYIRCMTLTQNVDPVTYMGLTEKNLADVSKYINDPMTASTVKKLKQKGSFNQKITSELIYYWMIQSGIPFECQKWHLNRLLMLINVCRAMGEPPKKMSNSEIIAQNRALNAARKQMWHTRG